jgi:alkanesulfonate monooxygenase SsuD/methylene tetrahydromethanopterin reductase-like flavin-dependent oxidoreductase (luciferase family)
VTDFGLAGFPARPDGVDRMSHYRDVLESLPPAFSTVWISDHFQFGDRSTAEGWTLLTYLAASFPRFRYGHLVLGQSFRNPALLAKMAATLQELTGGRYILGLGAGWHEEEYRAYRGPYEILRRHCEEIGRPFDEIALMCGLTVSLPDDSSIFEPTYAHSFYPGQVFDILGPTPAEVVREIERLVELGVSHFQVAVEDMTTLRRFVDEVVPAIRGTVQSPAEADSGK